MGSIVLSSSLRSVPPDVTLERAKRRARTLGITRVTDITRLDRVGIPVFTSIRPTAMAGSLCVSAGKGLRPIEAEVGAYMEAIELSLAEPGASPHVAQVLASANDVLDGRRREGAVLDLCPKMGVSIPLDAPMACVEAEEITTRERVLVPAELVFVPFPPRRGQRVIFGSSSNGLASGNAVREAVVHGLCEVVERDIRSFQSVRDTSVLVDPDTVDGPASVVVAAVRSAGLSLFIRAQENVYGLPYFEAVLHDPDSGSPHLLNGGYGCHPHRSVALVRAVCEAVQSRLTYIHGGRDDLLDNQARYAGWRDARKRAFVKRVSAKAARGPKTPLERVRDLRDAATDVAGCEALVLSRLRAVGIDQVYRVTFSAPSDELQVVRVIVPRLEFFNETVPRVGPRLRDHARAG